MPSIERRTSSKGEESFRARITLPGQPRLSRTFPTRRLAERWATRTEAAILERRYLPGSEAERRCLSDLITRFIAEQLEGRAKHKRLEKQLRWWEATLGGRTLLVDLTAPVIVEARDHLKHGGGPSGEPVSNATLNRYLAILSKACTVAVKEWFWLEGNPCANVSRLKESRGRVRFLSDAERTRLLEVCEASYEPRLYPLVLTAISTGARRGELLAVQWRDIDFARGLMTLHNTKNGERRSVPLAAEVSHVLRQWGSGQRDTDYAFQTAAGLTTFPRDAWEKALREAEIEEFRFHDLRHTAASYLAMTGATLMEIAEVLGHKTLAMVKRYAHLTEAHTRGVVERMSAKFLRPADDPPSEATGRPSHAHSSSRGGRAPIVHRTVDRRSMRPRRRLKASR